MSLQKKPQMVEAVVFFNDRGVGKQMLYPEFEALLDNVVQMHEFADQQMRLAYVMINPRLLVKATVFFYLDFDENGEADRGWNLPLRQLAERAGRGPDMGAGPIRLACRSQCPVSWHQMHLWDPSLVAGNNHLAMLRDAVKRNQLGLLVEEEPKAVQPQRLQMAAEHQWYAPAEESREQAEKLARAMLEEHRQKTAELLGQQESKLSSLAQQHEEELRRLRLGADEHVQVLQAELAALREGLKREEEINSGLRRELDERVDGFQRGREELTAQLRSIEQQGRDEIEEARAQIDAEARARIAKIEAQYKEQLAVRDAELSYRGELDKQLKLDNEALRGELAAQAARVESDAPLQKLAALGVIFVVYHPGAGHLTIPLQDIPRYQENPMAYAAAKCFVSEPQYRQWLAHYQQPTCDGRLSNGERCALPVDRVDNPGRFVEGDSNCCGRHKSAGRLRSVTTG
ncbi:chromosome partitioning protein ParA [Pseudomonas citronellolis]|uniref:chromosome partitioning protein ParA n=1 Tax=Pseudomonas citronellolis TaxID=53408 RepID=UPI0023E3DE9E|nr:chromosome partitioning protein ParA [Pseudomonas citronellolis]MDF3936251.1 chromosome partitioning protein ParA [Pseudomonas citronellolis]